MPQTYFITGTSRGLGLELVRQLARRGDRVIAAARSRGAADAAAGLAARFVELDVASEQSIAAAARALAGESIDVLINNAGVTAEDKTIDALDMATFTRVFTTNTFAPALLIRALLPNLRSGKGKTVVNISSGLGSLSTVGSGFSYAYCASKAALNMVTVRAAQDLAGEGFKVVTVHPGWVRTDMGGPNAHLAPDESIGALVRTMDAITPATNGKFLNYDGKPIAW